jgi:hypothetical protein
MHLQCADPALELWIQKQTGMFRDFFSCCFGIADLGGLPTSIGAKIQLLRFC